MNLLASYPVRHDVAEQQKSLVGFESEIVPFRDCHVARDRVIALWRHAGDADAPLHKDQNVPLTFRLSSEGGTNSASSDHVESELDKI